MNFDELKDFKALGVKLSQEEEEAMANIDTDGTGTLNIVEWLTWWLKKVGSSLNHQTDGSFGSVTFNKFDEDNSGSMNRASLEL